MSKHNIKIRLISLLLLLAILISLVPLNVIALSKDDKTISEKSEEVNPQKDKTCSCGGVSVLYNGAAHRVVTITEGAKEKLSLFVFDKVPAKISWQILIPDSTRWIDIYGASSDELWVSYALIGSMLNSDGSAFIRAEIVHDGLFCVSEPVEVKISYDSGDNSVSAPSPAATYNLKKANAPLLLAEEDEGEDEFQIFTIVINYIFDNGGIAFEPYGASVAKGSDFNRTVSSPKVTGYKPVIRDGSNYIDATEVTLDYTNITSDITLTVIYEPAIVKYSVHHHFQDLYDDDYSITPSVVTSREGLTGSIVPKGLELSAEEYPGYKPLAYELLEIAADGSTVVEIRYERNYYLIDFDMAGGYGVEPVYIRFGSSLGANAPTRHGYVFDKWKLASYNNIAPSVQQESLYDINNGKTITVPAANLRYEAIWITQLVNYTMVFWKENAENTEFSYWGHIDNLTAMSGSLVSGADRVREVGGIGSTSGFTYMDALTDKNILVEGDGSTIVNVYYSRNRYSITFKANALCAIPEKHSHTDDCYSLLCNRGHVHDESCIPRLDCKVPEHTEHTDDCVICEISLHTHGAACCTATEHEHTKDCFNNVGEAVTKPSGAPNTAKNGYIYATSTNWWNTTYYIHINGTWYRFTGRNVSSGDIYNSNCRQTEHTHGSGSCPCDLEEHSHVDTCYSDVIHKHDAPCYSYSCGEDHHVHSDGCYVLDCLIPTGHTHSNSCKRTNTSNTVKIESCKYQEDLENIWPITDGNGRVYDKGERWSPSGSNTYSQVLVFISSMPAENFTLTLSESNNDTYTMNYYTEVLDGEAYDKTYGGKYFKKHTTVKANYNYLTEAEDFFEINGFYKITSDPAFGSNGQIDLNGGGEVNFYYGRIVDHYLSFRSNGDTVDSATVHGIPYGASLKSYNFTPDYPVTLEPNAYFFDGWYTSPGHFDGTEVDWDTISMDEGDVMLYAKWSPILHSVKVYLDSSLETQIGEEQLVPHKNFAMAPDQTVEKGEYIFQGWFYFDEEDGVEKAFVFTGIPIIEDLKIYAKWSSHISVNYTIHYVLFREEGSTGDPIKIADTTTGSGIAGSNKTFYAKAGDQLYEGYREGYYPLTSSHTVTMSAETVNHEFTFEYVYVESVPYLVRYVNAAGEDIIEPKKVLDNNLSVVTETFVKCNKMMPDAYQKRLILSADGEDKDNDGIIDSNVIIFRYSEDEEHAYYKVVYYIQNFGGDGYREYYAEDHIGVIGNIISIAPISVSGFSYNKNVTTINGELAPTNPENGCVEASLTSNGLLFELYFDRDTVRYYVQYLDIDTNKVLYEDNTERYGIFGAQVVEYAPGLTHIGYTLVSENAIQINLSANESLNVITFYYTSSEYTLSYEIVGDTSGATLSQYSEFVKAVGGVPYGSMPTLKKGYHFVGWFLNASCTEAVPAEWVSDEGHLIPECDGIWLANKTYYAKVEPDYTTLTVKSVGVADIDRGEIFIFRIKGNSPECANIDVTVTVVDNSSVTVSHLPVGEYTVTELVGWAYRYTPDTVSKTVSISYAHGSDNSVTFSHLRTNTKWLDGNDNNMNTYD